MESKHTPGPSTARQGWISVTRYNERHVIGTSWGWANTDEDNANAELWAEATNVATETGLTPRQLAEQRAELLEALQCVVDCEATEGKVLCSALSKASAAIDKATKPGDQA